MNLAWLNDYSEEALGPVQQEEALFLFALARMIRPRTVLEFGSGDGYSARVWLEAGVERVFTVDRCLSPAVRKLAESDKRLTAIEAKMEDGEWCKVVGGVPLDLVFFDGAHDLAVNLETLERWTPYPKFLAVHDTGAWAREHMTARHLEIASNRPGGWFGPDAYQHQPDELNFAEELVQLGYQRIDFHSLRTLRHGISLFQL